MVFSGPQTRLNLDQGTMFEEMTMEVRVAQKRIRRKLCKARGNVSKGERSEEVVILCDQDRKKQGALKEDSEREGFHSNSPDLHILYKVT